jgi:hypothetical protein
MLQFLGLGANEEKEVRAVATYTGTHARTHADSNRVSLHHDAMASPSEFRRLAASIWCRKIGYVRGIRTVAASFLVVTREPSSSAQTGNEDFASKILSEMRGRREEESSSNGNTGARADSGSSYLAELTMRGLKARASDSSSQTESPCMCS